MANGNNKDKWVQAYDELIGTPPANQAATEASQVEEEKPKTNKWSQAYQDMDMENQMGIGLPGPSQLGGVEKSKYDVGYLTSFGDLNKYRAQAQPLSHELGNRLARLIPEVAVGTLEMLGYMTDVENIAGAIKGGETDFDNWLSESMRKAEKGVEEWLPVYSKNPDKVMDFGDSAWWVNNSFDTIESIMEFLTAGAITGGATGAVGRGLQMLGAGARLTSQGTRLAMIGRNLGNAIYKGAAISTPAINSLITAQGIGALNAYQVYDDLQTQLKGKINPMTNQVYTEDELNTLAGEQAAGTYRATAMASTVLNMTTLAPFSKKLKTPSSLAPGKNTKTVTDYLKQLKNLKADPAKVAKADGALKWYQRMFKPGSTIWEMGQEGIEEINENWQQQLGVHRGLTAAGQETKFDPFSDENILAFALGAFGGAVAKGGGALFSAITNKEEKESFGTILDRHIAGIENHLRFEKETGDLVTLLNNPQLNTEQREKLERDLDHKVKEWRSNAIESAFETETVDLIVQEHERNAQMSDEEAAMAGVNKAESQRMVETIRKTQAVNESLHGLLPKRVHKVATWTTAMQDQMKEGFKQTSEAASNLYNAGNVSPDVQTNSQIAALDHLIESTSDSFVKEEAQKLRDGLSKDRAEDADIETTNSAAIALEARKFNNLFLGDKYQAMYTALMDRNQRTQVLEAFNDERQQAQEAAAAIAEKDMLYDEIDKYLTRSPEDMSVNELNDYQKKLKESKDVKSKFIQDVQRDTAKLGTRTRAVQATIDQLKSQEKKEEVKTDNPPVDKDEAIDQQLEAAKKATQEGNLQDNKETEDALSALEKEDKPKPPVGDQELPSGDQEPGVPPGGQGLSEILEEQTKEEKPSTEREGKKIRPSHLFDDDGKPTEDEKPADKPKYKDNGRQLELTKDVNEETANTSEANTVLKETVQMDVGQAWNGKKWFSRMIDENDNSVKMKYIHMDEGGAQAQFDRLYTTRKPRPDSKPYRMPVYATEGTVTIKGIEYDKIKTAPGGGPLIDHYETYYLTGEGESAPEVTDVFHTTNGVLTILSPEFGDGSEVTILKEPTWPYWTATDPDTVTLNVYRRQDVSSQGLVLNNAAPLTQIPSNYRQTRENSPGVAEIRAQFKADPNMTVMETTVSRKTSGDIIRIVQNGELTKSDPRLLNTKIPLNPDKTAWTDDGEKTTPIIAHVVNGVATVPEGIWNELTEGQKNLLSERSLYGNYRTGSLVVVVASPSGNPVGITLSSRKLTDADLKYLLDVSQEGDNAFSRAKETRVAQGDGRSNFWPGLSELFQINRLGNPGSGTILNKYNPNTINHSGFSILVKGDFRGEQVYYSIATNKDTTSKGTTYSQLSNMMLGKPMSVEMYRQDGTKVVNPETNKTYWVLQGDEDAYTRALVINQLKNTYRNAHKDVIDKNEAFTDPVTGTEYDSYTDFLFDTGVFTTAAPADVQFENAGLWLDPVATGKPQTERKARVPVPEGETTPAKKKLDLEALKKIKSFVGKDIVMPSLTKKERIPTQGDLDNTIKRLDVLYKKRNPENKPLRLRTVQWLLNPTPGYKFEDYFQPGDVEAARDLAILANDIDHYLNPRQTEYGLIKGINPFAETAPPSSPSPKPTDKKQPIPPSTPETPADVDQDVNDFLDELDDETDQVSYRLAPPEKGFQVMSKRELDWFRDTFGPDYLTIAKGIDRVMINGKEAFGYYHNSMVTIAESAEAGTAYHEAFHLVFDLAMTDRQRNDLYNAARKKYKGGYSMTDSELEEQMADDFMVYRFNPENYNAKSVITKFFRMIRNYINKLLGKRITLDTLFQNISDGNVNLTETARDVAPRPRQILKSSQQQTDIINISKYKFMQALKEFQRTRDISLRGLLTDSGAVQNALDQVYETINSELATLMDEYNQAKLDNTFDKKDPKWQKAALYRKAVNNWADDNTDPRNPKDGFESLTKKSLAENGFQVKVRETTYKPEDITKENPGMNNDGEPDVDNMDSPLGDAEPAENSKDRIHDQAVYYTNPKTTLSTEIRMMLSTMPNYEVQDGKVVMEEDGKTPRMKLNKYGEPTMIGDFSEVYARFRDKLANVPMERMWARISELAEIHDDFAILKYELGKRRFGSDHYAQFMSHFNADNKKFITIVLGARGEMKVMETNRATLPQQILRTWEKQSEYMQEGATEEEAVVDKSKAYEAYNALKLAHAHYIQGRKQAQKIKDPVKKQSKLDEIAWGIINISEPALEIMGIKVDKKIWDRILKERPDDFLAIVTDKYLEVAYDPTDKSNRTNPSSMTRIVKDLYESGKDPFVEQRSSSLKKFVNLVEEYEIDNFTATFINGQKKTVYSINMHNHQSKVMQEIQENPGKFIREKSKDAFYNPGNGYENHFLTVLSNPDNISQIALHHLDTIKDSSSAEGVPYEESSNQQSIIGRLSAFYNSGGEFGFINTGTKSDKGQSIFIKLPKLSMDDVRTVLRKTVEQERQRINRINKYGKKVPGNSSYHTNGKKFLYIPGLDDIPGILEDRDVSNENLNLGKEVPGIEQAIQDRITAFMNQVVKANMDSLIEEGIIKYDEKNQKYTSTVIPSSFYTGVDLGTALQSFILNDFAWNMEVGKVFMGDLAFYNSKSETDRTTDYFKRAYQTITPGNDLYVAQDKGEKGTTRKALRTLVMKDPITRNTKTYLKELTRGMSAEEAAAVNEAYADFDTGMDAMSYCTVETWRELHLGLGTWTDDHRKMYEQFWSQGIDPNQAIQDLKSQISLAKEAAKNATKDAKTEAAMSIREMQRQMNKIQRRIKKTYLEPIKPFYYGDRDISLDDKTSMKWFEQVKTCIVPVSRTMARNHPEFEKMLNSMERKNVDMLTFESSVKIGKYGMVEAGSEADSWNEGENIKELPLKNYRVPQKVSTKEGDANAGTQMHKIIMGNLNMDDAVYKIQGKNITGRELLEQYDDAWVTKVAGTEKTLKGDLGLTGNKDGDWSLPVSIDNTPEQNRENLENFLTKLRNFLTNQNVERQLHENYDKNIEIVQAIEGDLHALKFAVPMDFPAFSRKYENILMAMFRNNILRQKFPGASMVQMADYGIMGDQSRRLKFIKRADGFQAAEIGVPQWFIREKLREELPVGRIDDATRKKLQHKLNLLGYRIPTQGKNSMLPLQIAEILPDEMGSAVMVPAEITVQMGSDFDVDKMFLMTRSMDRKTGEPVEYDRDAKGDSLNKAQLNNKILDLQLAVLSSDEHAAELIAPLSSQPLKEEANRFKQQRDFDHVNSLHTNIYQEYINKFAKQAVGITATYITGQTMYRRAGVFLQKTLDFTNVVNEFPPSAVGTKGLIEQQGHELGVEKNADGVLVSDILKIWNNAALDNAKDPVLGHLNTNNLTINATLLLSSLGYTLKTTNNFMNQPVIRELTRLSFSMNNTNITALIKELNKSHPAIVEEYNRIKSKQSPNEITLEDLSKNLKDRINGLDKEDYMRQAVILHHFHQMVDAGRDLAKVNKVLSPETAKNLATFSAIEEFDNIIHQVSEDPESWIALDSRIFNASDVDSIDLADRAPANRIALSPVPRVTAFYERGLKAADHFSQALFPYNTPAYRTVKDIIAKQIGANFGNLSREQIDIVNAKLGFLLLTEDRKLAEKIIQGNTAPSKFMFDKKNSLAKRVDEMKVKHPGLAENVLLRELAADTGNEYRLVQKIYYNNTSDRSTEEKNRMSRAWLSLINHDNADVRLLGRDLVSYAVVTSGFQMGPGSFFELIPAEYWEQQGLNRDWEDARKRLTDAGYLAHSADVVVRMSPELVTSVIQAFDREGNPDLTKFAGENSVITEEVKHPVTNSVIKRDREGNSNIYIKKFSVNLAEHPEYKVLGVKGNVAKPYLKIYSPVKHINFFKEQVSDDMSGFRLYKLDKQNDTHAIYTEVQPLGERFTYTEGRINDPLMNSTYIKHKNKPLEPLRKEPEILPQLRNVEEKWQWEPPSDEVEGKLRNFLTNLGVKVEAIDSIKAKFGVDARGAADIANSIVYLLNTEEGLSALPEEAAHFFVEGLADDKLFQRLISQVDGTEEYAQVLEQYSQLYNNDELKLRKEAAAKIIGKYLIKEQPAPKNWIRRILEDIRKLLQRVFVGRDPYQQSAEYILEGRTDVLAEIQHDRRGAVYFSAEPDPGESDVEAKLEEQIAKWRAEDLDLEKEINLDADQEAELYDDVRVSKQGRENLKKTFQGLADDVIRIIDKMKSSLRTRIDKIERLGQPVPKALGDLHGELNKLEGLDFLNTLAKGAMEMAEDVHEQFRSHEFIEGKEDEDIKFLRELEHKIASFKHLAPLKSIIDEKYDAEGDEDLRAISRELTVADGEIGSLAARFKRKKDQLLSRWLKGYTGTPMSTDEIAELMDKVDKDIGFMDQRLLSMADSYDLIISALGRKLKESENIANQQAMDYLRGTETQKGLSQLATELLEHKKTTDLEELYGDFIIWNEGLERYQFVMDPVELTGREDLAKYQGEIKKKWDKLQVLDHSHPVRAFYEGAIVPYLEERKKLNKKVIGAVNNIPVRKKKGSETAVGSAEWAKTRLENMKDVFKVLPDEDFVGAVDEDGKPIEYVPYRYNYKGNLSKDQMSLEIANGLALSMHNIFLSNQKREHLPLAEAALDVLANRALVKRTKDGKAVFIQEKSGTASRSYKKLQEMIQSFYYGKEDDPAEIGGKNISKVVRNGKSVLGFLNLGFNMASQIVNPLVQAYFIVSKGIGGRDYTMKDLRKGYAHASKSIAGMLKDYHSKNPTSKDTLIMERLGVFSHGLENINLGRKGNLMNNFLTKMGYAGFKLGNALTQPGVAFAMMMKKKIPGMDMNFYEAYTMKDGKLVLDPAAEAAMGGPEAVARFMAQIQQAIRLVSDNNAASDQGTAERHWWGKFGMMHRGWMVPMFMNMWSGFKAYDPVTGRPEEGFLRTSFEAIRAMLDPTKQNVLQLKNLAYQFNTLTTSDINPSTGKPFTEDELVLYKSNIKQVVNLMYTGVAYMLMNLFAWDDEDKKDSYSYYLSLRTKAEIFSMLNPVDLLRIVRSPTAAVNNLENLFAALWHTAPGTGGYEPIESGPYEGWLKVGRDWSKFVPVFNQYMNFRKTADKIKFMEKGGV